MVFESSEFCSVDVSRCRLADAGHAEDASHRPTKAAGKD